MKKTVTISDLHLGAENAPNRIEPLVHFVNSLDANNCEQLVILGDFLDRWALPVNKTPHKYSWMLENDPNCNKLNKALLDCSTQKVDIYCLHGNHDFDLKQHDLPNYIKLISPKEFHKKNPELYMEHGNSVDLFNANGKSDDGKIKFPLGYFKTRLNHSYKPYPMQHDIYVTHAKEDTITDLENYKVENPNMSKKAFDALLDNFSTRFLDALLKDVMIAFPKTDIEFIEIELPEEHSPGKLNFLEDILPNYKEFVKNFYYNNLLRSLFPDNYKSDIIQWDALINAIDPVRTGGLAWYAKALIDNSTSMENVKTILFGHTHMCQIENIKNTNSVYANSGCWCSNIYGPNTTSIWCNEDSVTEHNDDLCIEF